MFIEECVDEMIKYSHHRKNNKLNGKQISSLIILLIGNLSNVCPHLVNLIKTCFMQKQIIIWEKAHYYLEQLSASGEFSMEMADILKIFSME